MPIIFRDGSAWPCYFDEVSGATDTMRRVTPNGAKIAALRKKNAIKQIALAEQVDLCDRSLREIERKNYPVHEHILVSIATALKVTTSEITLEPTEASQEDDCYFYENSEGPMQMRLKRISSGSELFDMARRASIFNYGTLVDPTNSTVTLMTDMLSIVGAQVEPYNSYFDNGYIDNFEGKQFADLHRTAKLGDIIRELESLGIAVFANTYDRMSRGDEYGNDRLIRQTRLHIIISLPSQNSHFVDVVEDDKPKSAYDLDDDIPF